MAKHRNLKVNSNPTKSLSELIDQFISFKRAQGMSPRTLEDYQYTFSKFQKHITNPNDLTSLQPSVIDFFCNLSEYSPTTYNLRYKNLNCFFNWAVSHDYIELNPITAIGLKKKKDEGQIRHHETKDIKSLLSVINLTDYTGLRDYAIILLTLDTGIRPGEAFHLKFSDIDLQHNKLLIKKEYAKSRVSRELPLSFQVVQVLEKLISVKPPDFPNYLFISLDGNQMNRHSWGKRLREYSGKAGIRQVAPYDLRHTFAINFIKNGGNVFALQHILGHVDLEMTKRYVKLAENDIQQQHELASPVNEFIKRTTRVNKLFR